MAQPSFLSDTYQPRRTDTKRTVLLKWLGKVQTDLGGSAIAANDPQPTDTKRVIEAKLNAAYNGTAYAG